VAAIEARHLAGAPSRVQAKRALLDRYATSEEKQRNWFAHAGPIFLNALVAGVQLFGFHEPLMAGLQLGIGVGLSQTKVWTSPTAASVGRRDGPRAPVVTATALPGGAGLSVRW
jgi:hypothetical protein